METGIERQNIHRSLAHEKTAYQPPNVAISAVGIQCYSGVETYMLYGAVATNMAFARPDPVMDAPSEYGNGFDPVLRCEIADQVFNNPDERMLNNLKQALTAVLDSAHLTTKHAQKILVEIHLPNKNTSRSQFVDVQAWHNELSRISKLPANVIIRIYQDNTPVTQRLMALSEEIDQDKWDLVLFGAVDSLIDELTCQELVQSRRIQTTKSADGVIPGEAAAFIALAKAQLSILQGALMAKLSQFS